MQFRRLYPSSQWYMFGSITTSPNSASDIDLLVVCDSYHETQIVRLYLAHICHEWPIDLLLMTQEEACETGFVAKQRCKNLVS